MKLSEKPSERRNKLVSGKSSKSLASLISGKQSERLDSIDSLRQSLQVSESEAPENIDSMFENIIDNFSAPENKATLRKKGLRKKFVATLVSTVAAAAIILLLITLPKLSSSINLDKNSQSGYAIIASDDSDSHRIDSGKNFGLTRNMAHVTTTTPKEQPTATDPDEVTDSQTAAEIIKHSVAKMNKAYSTAGKSLKSSLRHTRNITEL